MGKIGKNSLIMTAMGNFELSKETLSFIVSRTINVCITTTCYIFCMCNKEWKKTRTLKLMKTDTNALSNMPYYGEYCCENGWKDVNSFVYK